jgi:hypothetical protein
MVSHQLLKLLRARRRQFQSEWSMIAKHDYEILDVRVINWPIVLAQ